MKQIPSLLFKWKCFLFKHPKYLLALGFLLITFFFSFHNSFLYSTPIGKIVKVKTSATGKDTNYSNERAYITENIYSQLLTIRIQNGSKKGTLIQIKNSFSYSQVDSTKYHKGDFVFLSSKASGKTEGFQIKGMKRDGHALILFSFFFLLLLFVSGKRGGLVFFTLMVNMGFFFYSLELYHKGGHLIHLSIVLMVLFTIFTLTIANGISFKTFQAILASFLSLLLSLSLFSFIMSHEKEIDYAALDYLIGNQDLETIFIAEIFLAGLGAVMDVAVTITSSLEELTKTTKDLSLKQFFVSGFRIGKDIMGTMITVLLFTYFAGLLPLMLIKIRNGIPFWTILRLQIPFEICRFFMGGIEILCTIPISILLSAFFFFLRNRRSL